MAIDGFLSGMILHEDVSPIDKWWCPIAIFVLGGGVLRFHDISKDFCFPI